MQVRAGAGARRADGPQLGVAGDLLARRDVDRGEVSVERAGAVGVLEVDEVAEPAVDAAQPPTAAATTPEKPASTGVPAPAAMSIALRVYAFECE